MNPYGQEPEPKERTMADLFGVYVPVPEDKNKRRQLVKYFHERALDRNGKQFSPSYIGMRLSYLSLFDLSAFKSDLEDRKRRFSDFNWNKSFWGGIKGK